jgi:iron-sulfur cluster insertion protein
MNLTITDNAILAIKDVLVQESPETCLRVFVQGGGCSGFQYGFALDADRADDDWDVGREGVTILIDSMSAQYLEGAQIDYVEDLMAKQFVINNPNANTTCGCGSSFSV